MFRRQPAIHPASLGESREIMKFKEIHRKFKEIHRKFKEIQGNSKEIHNSPAFPLEFPVNFLEFPNFPAFPEACWMDGWLAPKHIQPVYV